MTTPEKPHIHHPHGADRNVRGQEDPCQVRNNTDLSPNLHLHGRVIADTTSLSPRAANLSMLDAMFAKADVTRRSRSMYC